MSAAVAAAVSSYNKGRIAFLEGKARTDNPSDPNGSASAAFFYNQWAAGWDHESHVESDRNKAMRAERLKLLREFLVESSDSPTPTTPGRREP